MAEAVAGKGTGALPNAVAPSDADSADDASSEFSELRALLVGPEQRDLRALHAHLFDAAVQTREVSRVLPEALALRAHDPQLTNALAPSVEEAITASVHRDPQPLADALFPVMGPAIRKAIEHMLSSMMEAFNRSVEQSVSWRAVKWRLTAWRTGKPFAEIVLLNTLEYRVEQLFLIHAESGLLLQHVSAELGEGQDADQVSAMLTAIRDFVHDSFKVAGRDTLDAFRVGDLAITVEQGPFAILAGVVRGTAPHDIRVVFRRALESIHHEAGAALKGFKGDSAPFARIRPTLEACLLTQLRTSGKTRAARRWAIVAGILLVALGAWAFVTIRERQRWGAYLDRLGAEPGIVVVASGRRGGKFVVSGLRDPLAIDPATLVAASNLAAESVEGHWEPYQGSHPAFITARAADLLRPPPGVTLAFRDGVLTASGPAPPRWLVEAGRLAPAITGVRRFEYAGASAAEQLATELYGLSVLFAKGRSTLDPGQAERIGEAAAVLAQLNDAVRASGQRARVEVLGHTDNDGSDLANGPLGQARADTILRLVRSPALDALSLTSTGVGSTQPATSGTTESDKVRNRRASFRVTVTDTTASGSRP